MSSYVVAGGTTVSTMIKKLIDLGVWTIEDAHNFINKTTPYYLTSIAEGYNTKTPFNKDRFVKHVVKSYKRTYENEWFKPVKRIADSGGYQISVGYIPEENILEFIDTYIELLNHPVVGKASEYMLSLDIVGDYPTFKDLNKLEEFNRISLEKTIQYDTSKIFYVYHFVNPRLEQFWWKFTLDYFDYFNNFSIGGLVAFGRDLAFPFNVYILPLLKIINEKIARQKFEPFKFHILGVSSFTDIFSFIVFEKFLKEVYNFDITINFDSTRAVRETAIAKRIQIFYNGKLTPLSFRSRDLHKRVVDDKTNADLVKYICDYFNKNYNYNLQLPDKIEASDLYNDNGKGSVKREIEGLMILASIESLQRTVEVYEEDAENVVKAMLTGDIMRAERFIMHSMILTNFGKKTKKVVEKARALLNSLEIIQQKPDNKTIDEFLYRTLNGVQPFKLFDGSIPSNQVLTDLF